MLCGDWLTPSDVCPDGGADPRVVAAAIASATAWVYDSTCQQWPGLCTSTLRLGTHCGCTDRCGHTATYRRRDLTPHITGPVQSIVEVRIDGQVVDPADYRLSENRWLVPHRNGALLPWPAQDLNLPAGEPGTWSVTVTHGSAPPPHVLDAAADLAKELIARCTGGECRLPDNATSMSTDGVTFEFKVPAKGETGLPLVDTIIGMYPCTATRRMLDPAMPDVEVARVLGS